MVNVCVVVSWRVSNRQPAAIGMLAGGITLVAVLVSLDLHGSGC